MFISGVIFGAAFILKDNFMDNTTENRVAVISIIVEQPGCVNQINDILHSASDYIIGRMGIPYREKNISIVSVAIDAAQDTISSLAGKLGNIDGVSVKTAYSKVFGEKPVQK